jgi:glyoxalase family protein
MNPTLPGLHHVTAITADAQKNIDFYAGVLGLRLVKLTVNFDDPSSYHLYYGDELGRPGTILTFFAWPGAYRGTIGPPQLTATALAVPAHSLPFWTQRLTSMGIAVQPQIQRFGQSLISFTDPDGMKLEIVATDSPGGQPWPAGPIEIDHAIRGFHSVTLTEDDSKSTVNLLTQVMGFKPADNDQTRARFIAQTTDTSPFAAAIDIVRAPAAPHGRLGAGVVHHVAFRTPDDAQQTAWRSELNRLGLNVSPVMDRSYFHSIYYREPGGILFEIATENPGFTADESPDTLGSTLMLPSQYEPQRAELEKLVPPVKLPSGKTVGQRKE